MKQAKIISTVFAAITAVLHTVMCIFVTYQYCSLQCSTLHGGGDAPASIAFLFAVPFLVATGISLALCLYFKKKS